MVGNVISLKQENVTITHKNLNIIIKEVLKYSIIGAASGVSTFVLNHGVINVKPWRKVNKHPH